ncbi:hypothetical protein COTS27_00137 [Spirochaetota bacterium]|nr:hypothetical protein COTS27_00137 [Spirochaetota bacterium]
MKKNKKKNENNFSIGLNSVINDFTNKHGTLKKSSPGDIFEHFSNHTVVSNLREEELENLNAVSTNNAKGIDGIAIIINDRLIHDLSELDTLGKNEKLIVKIGFIQATTQKSFDENKFTGFVSAVINFLIKNKANPIEPFSTILEELLGKTYRGRLQEEITIDLYYLSAITNHSSYKNLIDSQKKAINNRSDLRSYKLNNISFWQNREIIKYYNKIQEYHKVKLVLDENTRVDEQKSNIEMSLLAAIKFPELKKLILTKNDNIKERLFVDNPRSRIPESKVNDDITETIRNKKDNSYFIYLNNGLTILCSKIIKHPTEDDTFSLTYPRIINGCQTTYVLYEQFKKNKKAKKLDNIKVFVKLIATEDNDLKEKIIFAANNQNAITKDLQSLNKFHKKIEEYFAGSIEKNKLKLYFERQRGQHYNIKNYAQKINIKNLAKVYISIFLREPHKMKSYTDKIIKKYQAKKIFYKDHDPEDYYYCGILYYWLNTFSTNMEIKLHSKTMDMILLLACHLFLEKKFKDTGGKIKYLSNKNSAKTFFKDAVEFINNKNYLRKRKALYSSLQTEELINDIKTSQSIIQ